MITPLLIAGLLGTYEGGVGFGAAAIADQGAILADPWISGRWGDFAMSLQAPMRYVPEQDGLRDRDWDEVADFGRLVRFVRYGDDADRMALGAGVVARRTLGHGTLVRRYYNTTDDDHYRVGLDGHAIGRGWGVEGFYDQIFGPPVVAVRAASAPIPPLTIGMTVAADTGAPTHTDGRIDANGAFVGDARLRTAYGVDAEWRLEPGPGWAVRPYLDVNRLTGSDPGVHLGMLVEAASGEWHVSVRGEYLYAGAGYDWAWLDTWYLVARQGTRATFGAAHGGRGGFEIGYADAATFGVEYADAQGDHRADLSAWLEIPTRSASLRAFYARRYAPTNLGDLLDPEDSLSAVAGRVRLSPTWWFGVTLARVWRVEANRHDPDHGALQPFTEAAGTFEATFGP